METLKDGEGLENIPMGTHVIIVSCDPPNSTLTAMWAGTDGREKRGVFPLDVMGGGVSPIINQACQVFECREGGKKLRPVMPTR